MEIGCENVLNWLGIGYSGRLLCWWCWTFEWVSTAQEDF